MERWACTVCGYVYIPEIGHRKSGILPGTKWEDIPQYWRCPLCGAGKNQFEKL
jgi:rubredoxin